MAKQKICQVLFLVELIGKWNVCKFFLPVACCHVGKDEDFSEDFRGAILALIGLKLEQS